MHINSTAIDKIITNSWQNTFTKVDWLGNKKGIWPLKPASIVSLFLFTDTAIFEKLWKKVDKHLFISSGSMASAPATYNKIHYFRKQQKEQPTSWNDAKYLYALRTASSFFASYYNQDQKIHCDQNNTSSLTNQYEENMADFQQAPDEEIAVQYFWHILRRKDNQNKPKMSQYEWDSPRWTALNRTFRNMRLH